MMIKVVNSSATSMVSGIATPQTVNSLLGLNSGSSGFIPLIPASSPSNPAVSANNIVPFSLNIGKQTKKPVSKKKTDDDDTNPWNILLSNPMLATPAAGFLSTLGIIGPKFALNTIKNDQSKIEYTQNLIDNLFGDKPLTPEQQKALFSNLMEYVKNPDAIKVPDSYLSLFPSQKQKEFAKAEYQKAAHRLASIFLLYPLRVFSDADGTLCFKSADFVAGTAVCTSVTDREALMCFAYLLRKMNMSLKDYYQKIHGRDFSDVAIKQMERSFSLATMRSIFGGPSYYRVPVTLGSEYEIGEDGKLILTQGKWWSSTIDSPLSEVGARLMPRLKNGMSSLLEIMDISAFGSLVTVEGGKDIIINDILRKGALNMQTAFNDKSVDADSHFKKLSQLTGEEFKTAYQSYISGENKNVKLGFFNEIQLAAKAMGGQVLEVKMMPEWMMDEEWKDKNKNPRLDHYSEIAELVENLVKNNPANWRAELKKRITPLSVDENNKLLVSTQLFNQIDKCSNIAEFRDKFLTGSPIFVTIHAVDSHGNFMTPENSEYNSTKELLKDIWRKYAEVLGLDISNIKKYVADNGHKAPYCELAFVDFDKSGLIKRSAYFIEAFLGDSQGTDFPASILASVYAYEKEGEIDAALNNVLREMTVATGIDQTNLPQEQRERLKQQARMGMAVSPRGQIDTTSNASIKVYAETGLKSDKGPFALQGKGSKDKEGYYEDYILAGDLFGDKYRNQTITKAQLKEVTAEKATESNILYKALKELAVPYFTKVTVRPGDVHSHLQLWRNILLDLFGEDSSKIDSEYLFNQLMPEEYRLDPYQGGYFNLRQANEPAILKFFGIEAQKNPRSLQAKIIYNTPTIGSYMALTGALMSVAGVGGKFYDNITHNNKWEDSFSDLLAKGFSLANLGLAMGSTFIQTQFFPFQVLGSAVGIGSGFLPSGNVQQYLALSSMAFALLGNATQSTFGYGSFIDSISSSQAENFEASLGFKDSSLLSGPKGSGSPNYFDPKVPASQVNLMTSKLHEKMIRWLYDNLKVNPKLAGFATKPIADFAGNLKMLQQTFQEPRLLQFLDKDSATNGMKYKGSPHSMPHFLNTAGFSILGLLGISAGLQAFNYFNKEKDKTQKALEQDKQAKSINKVNLLQFLKNDKAPLTNSPFLLDPKADLYKIPKKNDATDNKVDENFTTDNLSKAASVISALGSFIPAIVFLVQGLLIRQNALATRATWTDPSGKEIKYRPNGIGTGLAVSACFQGLSSLISGAASLGAFGNNNALVLNISQSLYNLFAASALAASACNVLGGGGGTIYALRNRTSKEGIAWTGVQPSLTNAPAKQNGFGNKVSSFFRGRKAVPA